MHCEVYYPMFVIFLMANNYKTSKQNQLRCIPAKALPDFYEQDIHYRPGSSVFRHFADRRFLASWFKVLVLPVTTCCSYLRAFEMAESGNKDLEKRIIDLVGQGFSRTEVQMALEESHGDMAAAKANLRAGRYAPPAYQEVCKNTRSCSSPDFSAIVGLPPPYQLINTNETMIAWERENNIVHMNNNEMQGPSASSNSFQTCYNQLDARCPVCYSKIIRDEIGTVGVSIASEVIQQHGQFYHYDCFTRRFSPKCAHCCFPLDKPDEDHELSGRYMQYEGKDLHVECYERFAGPRCWMCCNVIIERPNGEYSGHWIADSERNGEKMHVECYQRKLRAQWRVQNS